MGVLTRVKQLIDEHQRNDSLGRKPESIAIDVQTGYQVLSELRSNMPTETQQFVDKVCMLRDDDKLRDVFLTATLFGISVSVVDIIVTEVETSDREVRAEMLLRDMFMKCRDSQRVHQHNPYTWAELNKDLMQRLKEFM
jgi:hypothetical protein